MARKKTKKKSTGKKSGKRIRGASGQDTAFMVLGGILGAVGLTWISQKVSMLSNKWAGIAEVIVGGVLAWKVGNPFARGLGVGIAVAGSFNSVRGFGLLAGIGSTRNFRTSQPALNGFRDVPKIGQPFPKPNAVGRPDTSRMYAGVYN